MLRLPFAYHITFGTYGTRLHGDTRGTVDRRHNQAGQPVLASHPAWRQAEANRMRYSPVVLSHGQCLYVENVLPDLCRRGGWTYHLVACQKDHVHVLLSGEQSSKLVRRWLKFKLGRALSDRWPCHDRPTWWAEGGSIKHIYDEPYFRQVFEYIAQQRASGRVEFCP